MKNKFHNFFWPSYVDFMTNLFAIILVLFVISFTSYRKIHDTIIATGGGNIDSVILTIEQQKLVKAFYEAQKDLKRTYFRYNDTYKRFECNVDVLFEPESPIIPAENEAELIEAGHELDNIIKDFKKNVNISFKLVIEGRAAKPHNAVITSKNYIFAEKLSFQRAENLYHLWLDNYILQDIRNSDVEVFISGSGFGGKGRYEGFGSDGEDKNKTFIIQIIPYLNLK